MRRLKALEDENSRLKKIVANLTLDREMLQDVIRRKLGGLPAHGNWSMGCWWTGTYQSAGRVEPCILIRRATITNPAEPGRPLWY